MSDLCVISEPSTTGLEAIAIGRPLVQLELSKPDEHPYDFVKEKVALHLTPEDLSKHLKDNYNFADHFSPSDIKLFIENELTDTKGAADRIASISQKVIQYNTDSKFEPFEFKIETVSKEILWSIVVPVSNSPKQLLGVLESISLFSENKGEFEILLVLQGDVSDEIKVILDSLEGHIKFIQKDYSDSLSELLNAGAFESEGDRLVFLDKDIAPTENWLNLLDDAYSRHKDCLLGARVVNLHDNIVHAGLVMDTNHYPVSAYRHLDSQFPHVMKERPYQMVDKFVSLNRSDFKSLGGFHPKAGRYSFMDLCLKNNQIKPDNSVMYIPEIKLIDLNSTKQPVKTEESIYFFSRWSSELWESEEKLYQADGVSQLQLESARMTRAMEVVGK